MSDDRKLPPPRNNKYPPKGITLEIMLRALVEEYGWSELGQKIYIRCFNENPSLKSSLTFLNKMEWARLLVEDLYIYRFGTDEEYAARQKLIAARPKYDRDNFDDNAGYDDEPDDSNHPDYDDDESGY